VLEDDVFDQEAHRILARAMLASACAACDIDVAEVEFGPLRREDAYSWLCYVADPASDDLTGPLTAKSAVDHFKRYDPGGLLRNSSKRLAINVHELETSGQASFVLVGEEGQDVLISPWQRNLLVARATFTYLVM
jgi:hypothetical protein